MRGPARAETRKPPGFIRPDRHSGAAGARRTLPTTNRPRPDRAGTGRSRGRPAPVVSLLGRCTTGPAGRFPAPVFRRPFSGAGFR